MASVTGITHSMTAAPAFQVWLLPQWPKTTSVFVSGVGWVDNVYPADKPIPLPADVTQAIMELKYTSRKKDLGGMDTFDMVVLNDAGRFTDTPWFQEGNLVDMSWGYAPDNITARKLGIITAVDPAWPQRSSPVLVVKGNCLASPMAARKRYGVWRRVNWGELPRSAGSFAEDLAEEVAQNDPQLGYAASEIAIILAEAYGLKADVEYIGPIKEWCQCGETDWDFLKRLANEAIKVPREKGDIGVRFWVEGNTLHFHSVTADPEKDVLMTLVYYCDDTGILKEVRLKHDTQLDQGPGVEVTASGYDPRRMTAQGFTALNRSVVERVALGMKTSLEPGAGVMRDRKNQVMVVPTTHRIPPELLETHTAVDEKSTDPLKKSIVTGEGKITPTTTKEVNSVPDPTKREAADGYTKAAAVEITGTVVTVGWPTFEAEKLIELQNLGAKYSGLYEIEQVVHAIARSGGKSGYECAMNVRRSAKGQDDGKYDAEVNKKADIVDKAGEKIGPELRPMVKITPEMLPSTVR